MKLTTSKGVCVAAGAALLAFVTTPAQAVTITDGSGVDFDAACVVGGPTAERRPNSVASPGASDCVVTGYDGSTESTDFSTVDVSSNGGRSWPPSTSTATSRPPGPGRLPVSARLTSRTTRP